MDADQPKTTKHTAHDDFIIIINHISNHKSPWVHEQYAASLVH